jgi:hypothetical protein
MLGVLRWLGGERTPRAQNRDQDRLPDLGKSLVFLKQFCPIRDFGKVINLTLKFGLAKTRNFKLSASMSKLILVSV